MNINLKGLDFNYQIYQSDLLFPYQEDKRNGKVNLDEESHSPYKKAIHSYADISKKSSKQTSYLQDDSLLKSVDEADYVTANEFTRFKERTQVKLNKSQWHYIQDDHKLLKESRDAIEAPLLDDEGLLSDEAEGVQSTHIESQEDKLETFYSYSFEQLFTPYDFKKGQKEYLCEIQHVQSVYQNFLKTWFTSNEAQAYLRELKRLNDTATHPFYCVKEVIVDSYSLLLKPSGKVYLKLKQVGVGAMKEEAPAKMALVASTQFHHMQRGYITRVFYHLDQENEFTLNRIIRACRVEPETISHLNVAKSAFLLSKSEKIQYGLLSPCLTGTVNDLVLGGLTYRHKIKLALEMCQALKQIHRLNIVHRDLKPDNFLYEDIESSNKQSFYTIKLTDLGVSTLTNNKAPSYFVETHVDPLCFKDKENFTAQISDLYQLGVLLYQLFTETLQDELYNMMRKAVPLQIPLINEEGKPTESYYKSLFEWKIHPEKWEKWHIIKNQYGFEMEQLLSRLMTIHPQERPTLEETIEVLNEMNQPLLRFSNHFASVLNRTFDPSFKRP